MGLSRACVRVCQGLGWVKVWVGHVLVFRVRYGLAVGVENVLWIGYGMGWCLG